MALLGTGTWGFKLQEGWLRPPGTAERLRGAAPRRSQRAGGFAAAALCALALPQRRLRRTARGAVDAMDAGGVPRRVALGLGGTALFLAGLKRFAIDGPPEFDPKPNSMSGKTVLITGGNTGLGRESALRLAKAGATVVLTTRSAVKGQKAVEEVKAASGSNDVHFLKLDLADLNDVKSFKQRFTAEKYGEKIDVLMNNAGVMAIPQRQETKDGFEQQFGVNHLGHFALTGELLPLLEKAPSARVVVVSSTTHLGANKELMEGDLMAPEHYTQWGAYCQSKLANVLFAKELNRRFQEAGLKATAVSCHPGGVDTDLARWTISPDGDPNKATQLRKDTVWADALATFLTRTVQLGANTQVYLAAGGDGGYNKSGGEYFDNMAPGLLNPVANDKALAKELWSKSEQLTGVSFKI